MDKKKLETCRKKLETRRQELRHMVVRNQQDGRTVDDEATQDVADRAASSYNKEFLFSQSNNDRQLLNMVDGALARIREGSFGECVSCGKEINAKRLEAVPWTRHCIECQEKAEQGLLEAAQSYLVFRGARTLPSPALQTSPRETLPQHLCCRFILRTPSPWFRRFRDKN